jgi:hypothetical protein
MRRISMHLFLGFPMTVGLFGTLRPCRLIVIVFIRVICGIRMTLPTHYIW